LGPRFFGQRALGQRSPLLLFGSAEQEAQPLSSSSCELIDGSGIASLTERELQVARLVVDRKTNPEIAAELFLSQKTVETHLRNIFHKMDVTTRADLARAVERADRTVSARPR
jgi:DNA-binding CsgD family transcriptional regulator